LGGISISEAISGALPGKILIYCTGGEGDGSMSVGKVFPNCLVSGNFFATTASKEKSAKNGAIPTSVMPIRLTCARFEGCAAA
jgi:hypothetical protein